MKAIVTRANPDGSFDEVGMNNRFVTNTYKTKHGLLRYGIPAIFKGKVRIEIFNGSSIYGSPIEITVKEVN